MIKKLLSIGLLVLLATCGPVPPPVPPTIPSTVWHVYVQDSSTSAPLVNASVFFNGQEQTTNNDGYTAKQLPLGFHGIVVKSEDYHEQILDTDLQVETVSTIRLQRIVPPLQRLIVCGIDFCTADGQRWHWRGLTAFSLAFDISQGRETDVIAFLDWAKANDVTIVRVLTTAVGMFDLSPDVGLQHADAILRLAQERGLYVELVGLADTKARNFDHQNHLRQLGTLCENHAGCLIEIANEPNHETQDSRVKDPTYLAQLRSLIPAHILVALGASHGTDDENTIYWGGDYATVHADRTLGEGGWRAVRHIREQQALRDSARVLPNGTTTRKPVVNDEPPRDILSDQHLGMALLTRLYSLGDTIHLAGLRFGRIPTGDELIAFQARLRGWTTIPQDWFGRYCNNSSVQCNGAVTGFDATKIIRLYGALAGDTGFIVGLGVQSEDSIRWGWSTHERLVNTGQARLWKIAR